MCVYVCVVHWYCSAQLSMFNMEKRYRNKIIIIITKQQECVFVTILRGPVCIANYRPHTVFLSTKFRSDAGVRRTGPAAKVSSKSTTHLQVR